MLISGDRVLPKIARHLVAGWCLQLLAASGLPGICSATEMSSAASGPATPAVSAGYDRAAILLVFAQALDAETMAMNAIGRYWGVLDAAEQARFVTGFRDHLIAMAEDVLPAFVQGLTEPVSTIQLAEGERLIWLTIRAPRLDEPLRFGMRVRGTGDGKIVDLLVSGVSLTTLKRDEISALAGREGFDAVIGRLGELSKRPTQGISAPVVDRAPP